MKINKYWIGLEFFFVVVFCFMTYEALAGKYMDKQKHPAPIDYWVAEDVFKSILKTQNRYERHEYDKVREYVIRAFNENGYNFRKTVDAIAENPAYAQNEGNWTAVILGMFADLSNDELFNVFTKEEANSLLNLRNEMDRITREFEERKKRSLHESNDMMRMLQQRRDQREQRNQRN